MYEVEDDTYCYPGTPVLRNKLDLRNAAELADFEAEITDQRATEPFPAGLLDYAHYKAIHRHLFRLRLGGQASDCPHLERRFCYPEYIDGQMEQLFSWLQSNDYLRGLDKARFAQEAAHFLAELNAIHPFREGNGRTQLSFLTMLAELAGHPLDLDRLDPRGMLDATIESFGGDENALASQIAKLL